MDLLILAILLNSSYFKTNPGIKGSAHSSGKVFELDNFHETVEKFEPMIHQIIHSLHIYKNYDEFYQIGLIALWEASVKFVEGKGIFSSYAYATIKGRMLTELAKAKKREERNAYPEEGFWEYRKDPVAEEPLELAILLSYCDQLKLKEKKWVIMTFYFGMNTKEIADKEKVSPSAVKKWRNGAMDKLRMNKGE
ncbi:sigma-70 family RNA polymerase sigma factor [Heyndrickxia sp. NPDC080065]|uniref:sigma-70 family RNA polymerase sigma factor n=1 Tax=Heyndrickxia sp. NPDC080065 TaxID=3390568 RepID=UPI003D037478